MIWLRHMELDEINLDAMEDLVEHVNETDLLDGGQQDGTVEPDFELEGALKEKMDKYIREEEAEVERQRKKERKNCAAYGCASGAVAYPMLKNIYRVILHVFHAMPFGFDVSEEFFPSAAAQILG